MLRGIFLLFPKTNYEDENGLFSYIVPTGNLRCFERENESSEIAVHSRVLAPVT